MRVHEIEIPEQMQMDGVAFPLVLSTSDDCTFDELVSWVCDHHEELRRKMTEHGAVLLRGFPVTDAVAFETTLDAAQFVAMPYVGGAAPRSQVTARRVLTANEAPASERIPFHHEMAQVPEPPRYVLFYCDVAPESGGETAIVHSHRVYQRFLATNPDFAAKVEDLGVRYIRVLPDQDDITSPIGRSWRSTYQTQDRSDAEARMKALGTSWRWQADGTLHTETAVVPAVRTEANTGKKTFFNSIVAAYTGWADSRNDPTKAVVCGDGSPMDAQAVLDTQQAMDEECVAFPWQPGDVLLIDNNLVMHSRRPFVGERRILASIAVG